jgi:DNA-directed RNA polymerase I, II, and III subunit RPABC2
MNNFEENTAMNEEFNLAENMERMENESYNNNVIVESENKNKVQEPQGTFKFLTDKKILQSIEKVKKTTPPFLTKFEKARIIGVRMQQLASGAKPCVDIRGLKSIEEIAYAELNQRTMPFIVKRPLPNGIIEYWRMEEFDIV